jgi:hypothetical protein
MTSFRHIGSIRSRLTSYCVLSVTQASSLCSRGRGAWPQRLGDLDQPVRSIQ